MAPILTSRLKFPLVIFAALAVTLVSVALAHAAPGSQAITMTPSSTQITVDPGSAVKRDFKIINSGSDSYNVNTSITPYHVEGDNYDPQFTQLPGTKTPTDWIKLDTDHTVVKPGKTVTVDYSLSVPASTVPGGYYAVLFAETSPLTKNNGGVVPHNRVGNVLYITVKGPVKTGGAVTPADLSHFVVGNTVPLGVKVSNTGGVHFTSTTKIDVTNIIGKDVYHASLERIVLPQTERLVSTDWEAKAPIGLYHVSRSATADGQSHELSNSWIIVVQPWFMVAIVALIVMIVIYLVIKSQVRRRKKNASR